MALTSEGCRNRARRRCTLCGTRGIDLVVLNDIKNIFHFTNFLRKA